MGIREWEQAATWLKTLLYTAPAIAQKVARFAQQSASEDALVWSEELFTGSLETH